MPFILLLNKSKPENENILLFSKKKDADKFLTDKICETFEKQFSNELSNNPKFATCNYIDRNYEKIMINHQFRNDKKAMEELRIMYLNDILCPVIYEVKVKKQEKKKKEGDKQPKIVKLGGDCKCVPCDYCVKKKEEKQKNKKNKKENDQP